MRTLIVLVIVVVGLQSLGVGQDLAKRESGKKDEVVSFDKAPEAILMPRPEYPPSARDLGLQGAVWVKVLVGIDGTVHDAVVAKTAADLLSKPALDAAAKWTFKPATKDRVPVAVWVRIPFMFKLETK